MKGSKKTLFAAILAAFLAVAHGYDIFAADGDVKRTTVVYFGVFAAWTVWLLLRYFGVIKEKPNDPKEKFDTFLGITIGFGCYILVDWLYEGFSFDRLSMLKLTIFVSFVIVAFCLKTKKDNKNNED